ncbi:MAG: S8 family serine peptidase [Brumimicrobium sp.]|nr:S8 family serine peptidase [Brumimicrobium sp.]
MYRYLLIIFFLKMGVSFSQSHDPDYLDGVIYLKTISNPGIILDPYDYSDVVLNQIIADHGISEITASLKGLNDDTLDLTHRIHFSNITAVNQLITELEALNWVDYAEKAPLFRTSFTPNDANSSQWYLEKIDAFTGWDYQQGNSDVVIAIVDNAVRITHDDLVSNVWVNPSETENGLDSDLNGYTDDINGYDVADQDNDPNPPASFSSGAFSHGTHVAGTASGSTNNNLGIAGIGFNCSIMAVKCSPDTSSGSILYYAYEGLKYAVDAGADIISMSWGGRASSFTGEALLNSAALQGITMFAAAGNNDEENLLSPSSHPSVIAVGATDQNDQKASFSNYHADIDFMAPGVSIYNLLGGNNADYGYSNGTSMACPIAAGIGGIILSQFPNYSPQDIRSTIAAACDDIEGVNANYQGKLGAGRVNLGRIFSPASTSLNLSSGADCTLYPNPTNEEARLVIKSGEIQIAQIRMFDQLGREITDKIMVKKLSTNTVKLSNLVNLSEGIYFLSYSSENPELRLVIQ